MSIKIFKELTKNQNAQQASLIQCAKACSQPTLFGDERDQIMAKLNIGMVFEIHQ